MYVCMYVCMYNFYLNKLFELFILLKEIIRIIKTHIKLILNMNNLFSKFYCRDRETTCDGEFKNTIWKGMNPKYGFKNYNDSSIYCRVIRKNKKNQDKENNHFFKRECERE